ncbi:MAG TPA: ACP phosphodiesterase [Steroidobacter sp.]
MNWLAHVFLSESDIEFRLGNLLADLVRGEARERMSPRFRLGAEQHRIIDAYTDAHPVVRHSRSRIDASRRRFSGVLVDVFYDHFLARSWQSWSSEPLEVFISSFYTEASAAAIELPEPARSVLARIVEHDLLGSYLHTEGVERSLKRLSLRLAQRWRRPFDLERGVADLLAHHEALAGDFAKFFPALREHVATHRPVLGHATRGRAS